MANHPRVERFESIRSWWKTDDLQWRRTRAQEWERLNANVAFSDRSARERAAWKACWLTGELPDPAPWERSGRVDYSEYTHLGLIPVASAADVQVALGLFSESERSNLYYSGLAFVGVYLEGLDDLRARVRPFAEVLAPARFEPIHGTLEGGRYLISPPPRQWFGDWCGEARRYLKGRSKFIYSYCLDSIEWAFSMRDHYLALGESDPDQLESLRAAMASVDPEALERWPRALFDALVERLPAG